MRILHVDTAAGWRGGQNQVLLTARGQALAGHPVRLLCRSGGMLEARAREAAPGTGLEVEGASLGGGDLAPGAIRAVRASLHGHAPDIVQLHDPHAVAAGVAARALGAKRGPKLVATRRVDFPVRGRLSRFKYRACDRIVAVSAGIARVLSADGFEAHRVRVVHEGVPDRPAEAGGRDSLEELGVPRGHLVVGVVAALTGHKDHHTLLHAAAAVVAARPDVHFFLAGDGELRGALEALATRLGVARACTFAGFRDDLDRLVPAFDVFCLPSRLEGLGTSLLDAMCFARPVVATAAGGIPEAVDDGVTGRLAPVGDSPALAAALLELLGDPALRRRLGEAGRRRFVERFTAERMVEATLGVYRELL